MKSPSYKRIIIFLFTLILCISSTIGILYFSHHYQDIYQIPKVEHATIDLQEYDINTRKVDYLLAGEWEFYYNQWIVTDGILEEKTGMITLPCRWNEYYDIPKEGYASYRLMIQNPHPGEMLSIVLNNYRGTYRTFINGQLVCCSGELSKEKSQSFSRGRVTYQRPFEVESSQDIELIIEVGYHNFGGFYSVPWLTGASFTSETHRLANRITFLILFMIGNMFCFLMMSLVLNLGIYKKEKMICYSVLLLSLFFNQIVSKDGCLIWTQFFQNIDYRIYARLWLLSIFFIFTSFLWVLKKEGIQSKLPFWINILPILVNVILIEILFGTKRYVLVPICLLGLYFLYWHFKVYMNRTIKRTTKWFYCVFMILLYGVIQMELLDSTGIIVFGTEGIVSFLLLFLMILITIYNYFKMRAIVKENARMLEVENELRKIKEKTLRAQIKPHFIFNTLTCIQHLYHENIIKGDIALTTFSNHLRLNVDTETNDLVDFESEIDNIQNYFQLENMRYGNTMNLYFDINTIDFQLPILSLQPFVENSIKHGKLSTRTDGWIQISSIEEQNQIIIRIVDNGVGFHQEQVRKDACGIQNCKERLKLLLGASVTIYSIIHQGTIVEIRFAKPKKETHI